MRLFQDDWVPAEAHELPLAAIFGGEGLFFARLSGPGTFYLQSLPAAARTEDSATRERWR